MPHSQIDRWIVLVMGFTQSVAGKGGIESLHAQIQHRCYSAHSRIALRSYSESPQAIADWIVNRSPHDRFPGVVLIGYSFGGSSAVRIAQALQRHGIDVEHLFLLDAVWRSPLVPMFLTSYMGWMPLEIPSNVANLYSWRQIGSRPRGSRLTLQDEKATEWQVNSVLAFPNHASMDSLKEAHRLALEKSCPEKEKPCVL